MKLEEIEFLIRQGVFQVLKLCGPVLIAALIVGLIIAIFQATTSIQEQTLTFLPKLFVILIVISFLGKWMFSSLRQYFVSLLNMISNF